MSSEVSIAKPLSGSEALDAVLHRLRETLAKDDRFQSHMSYKGFRAAIDFRFYPVLDFIPPVERTVVVESGDLEGIETLPTVSASVVMDPEPPNKIREDAGMPQPVLVTDGQGRSTEKWVQRGKVPNSKAGVPKNTVRGGVQ